MAIPYILGIDTSNYTTSLAAVGAGGEILADIRRPLPVAPGERGLRQSDALFFHVQHLPEMFSELRTIAGLASRPLAIGVSVRPRPFAESYMPVFRTGTSFADVLGHTLGIPVIRTTHQEGHVAAAVHSLAAVPKTDDAPFLAVHLSGGTSDVILARSTRFGYHVELVGEGQDLHAGQFVDRVGVALGLPFPAGPHLEALAMSGQGSFRLPSSVRASRMSFSGPCSAALRAGSAGIEPSDIAAAVQDCISNSVVKAMAYAIATHPGVRFAVVAGGVASNESIRTRVVTRLHHVNPEIAVRFAPANLARDNAVGVAQIARRFLQHREW